MEISLIGENAGMVWNALNEQGELEMAQIKKITGLSEGQIAAAMGWLAREGKIQATETKKGRKKVTLFALVG